MVGDGPWNTLGVASPEWFEREKERREKAPVEEPVSTQADARNELVGTKRRMRPTTILRRRLARLQRLRVEAHPDRGGKQEDFIRINAKYEELKAEYESLQGIS